MEMLRLWAAVIVMMLLLGTAAWIVARGTGQLSARLRAIGSVGTSTTQGLLGLEELERERENFAWLDNVGVKVRQELELFTVRHRHQVTISSANQCQFLSGKYLN